MLSNYLNQVAQYEKISNEKNVYNEYTYSAIKEIPVRRQPKIGILKRPNAEEVQTKDIYYTTYPCTQDSRIDGKIILLVAEWVDLQGITIGYKVLV
jgi:hypothetical protein